MSNAAKFTGSIPSYYDSGLGPNLFTYYAKDISHRVAATLPKSVLELAAGTGIVTEQLDMNLEETAELISTDLNQAMLDIAKTKIPPKRRVILQSADAMNLPFENNTFDTLVCQFGIMFFPDKLQSMKESHRVLNNDGHYIFNVWSSWSENPFAQIVHNTIASFFKGEPPKFYEVPFGYYDIDEISHALETAGFRGINAKKIAHEAPLRDIPAFAKALVYGNPVREEIISLGGDPDEVVTAIETSLQRNFGASQSMPLEAIIFSARK